LAREGTDAFNAFVADKVNMTTEKMRDEWEFDERRTCEEEIKRQVETYRSRLTTNLEGTGIEHLADHRVDLSEDHLCQCRDPNVTGASLQFERLAVVTQCDKQGKMGVSTFHTMTPSTIAQQPSFIEAPLPSLDETKIADRKRFLRRFNTSLKGSAIGHPVKWPNTTKKRNDSIMQKMRREPAFSDLEHIFQYCKEPDIIPYELFTKDGTLYSPVGFVNIRNDGPDGQIGPVTNPGGSEDTYRWVQNNC
jgi:hypothetical protein